MQVLLVEFIVHAAMAESFAAVIAENARASRDNEPGCRQFDVCRDGADPCRFVLYELYDGEAAVQAHLHSAHFLAMNAATAGWVRDKTVHRLERMAP